MAKNDKPVRKRMWMIDPIYRKFTAKAFETLTGGEFYEFFQTMLRNGEHEFQFSNRKLHMSVDESWVQIIEDTVPAFIEIARNPRVIITQEELITNVVQAKKIDSQVVKHLCSHSYLVDAIDENGDVVPGKVLNIFKEETWDTYENRFVFTLMRKTYDFISKRYNDMKNALNDEFGATLIIKSTALSNMENVSVDTKYKIKQRDDFFDSDDKKSIFYRIEQIYQAMMKLMDTQFAHQMNKYPKVVPPLVATNAIKKNPYLRKCHKLWDFLLAYFDVGYSVEIIEQNPEINEKFEQDIWDNIMFTYIILKGYLEDNRDRAMDPNVKSERRILRPRYIKEIVEELVRNFNLTDVEVRKILVEELTKEQLMREEQKERYRLVEEQKQRKEEEKRLAEKERIRKQKEAEREKLQAAKMREKEKEKQKKLREIEAARKQREAERQNEWEEKLMLLMDKELAGAMDSVEAREKREEREKKAAEKAEKARLRAEKLAANPPKPKKPKAPKAKPEEVPEAMEAEVKPEIPEASKAVPEVTEIPEVTSEVLSEIPEIEEIPEIQEITEIPEEISEEISEELPEEIQEPEEEQEQKQEERRGGIRSLRDLFRRNR